MATHPPARTAHRASSTPEQHPRRSGSRSQDSRSPAHSATPPAPDGSRIPRPSLTTTAGSRSPSSRRATRASSSPSARGQRASRTGGSSVRPRDYRETSRSLSRLCKRAGPEGGDKRRGPPGEGAEPPTRSTQQARAVTMSKPDAAARKATCGMAAHNPLHRPRPHQRASGVLLHIAPNLTETAPPTATLPL